MSDLPTHLAEEKFGLAVGFGVAVIATWATTHWVPGLAATLSTVVGGLTAVFGIYCGAHVSQAWVSSKSGAPEMVEQDVEPASPFVEPDHGAGKS